MTKLKIGFGLAVIIIILIIYSSIINSPFVFDDNPNIVTNPHIRNIQFDLEHLRPIIFSSRPVAKLSFALNYYFHQYKVAGYHQVNIIIHLLNGFLLYLFISQTLLLAGFTDKKHQATAFWAVLLWLVHPLQIQSVSYIVQRMNALAVFFYLTGFNFYILGRLQPHRLIRAVCWGAALLCGLLSIGSKENGLTLLFFIFMYEWIFFQKMKQKWLHQQSGTLLEIILMSILAGWIMLDWQPSRFNFTIGERLLTEFRVVVYYLSLLIFPHPARLHLDYNFPVSKSLFDPWTTLASITAVLTLCMLNYKAGRKNPIFSFCLLWFLGQLVIESSVISLDLVFEHRLYLPSMLLFLIPVMSIRKKIKFPWQHLFLASLVLILALWTWQRNHFWQSQLILWHDNVIKTPLNPRVLHNYGSALEKKGRLDEAVFQYIKALQIDPFNAECHYNIGNFLSRHHRFQTARAHYSQAIKTKPDFVEARCNLGLLLTQAGQANAALDQYQKALKSNPDFDKIYINMGTLLASHNHFQTALTYFSQGLALRPDDAEAHNNMGVLLAELKDFNTARQHFLQALQLEPNYKEVYANLGYMALQQGNLKQAIFFLKTASN